MSEEYNGWANRETWALHLHLTNTNQIQEEIKSLLRGLEGIDGDDALLDWVESRFEDVFDSLRLDRDYKINPDIINMVKDVGSYWRINWKDVTDAFKKL